MAHIYNGILLSHKKKWNHAICRDMDRPTDCHTQWSQSEREDQISYINTYMWNLKKWYRWAYLQSRKRGTDVENKGTDTKGVKVAVGWIRKSGQIYIHCYVQNRCGWDRYSMLCGDLNGNKIQKRGDICIYIREGSGTPLQYSCLENPMDGGAWWAAVHGVAKSWAWLSDFPFTFHFHALEKEMATHSSVLAWRIPGTGEPGGLLSMGSHRVGHDWNNLAAAACICIADSLCCTAKNNVSL